MTVGSILLGQGVFAVSTRTDLAFIQFVQHSTVYSLLISFFLRLAAGYRLFTAALEMIGFSAAGVLSRRRNWGYTVLLKTATPKKLLRWLGIIDSIASTVRIAWSKVWII
jgi:hypothetical protein